MSRPPSALSLAALALCLPGCVDDGRTQDTATAGSPTTATTSPPATTTTATTANGTAATTDDSGAPTTGTAGGLKYDIPATTGDGTTGGPDTLCPCAPKLDLIYVLSDDRELWTYDPQTNTFAMIGELGCPTIDGTFAMAVGRDGSAWIQTTAPTDIGGTQYVGDMFRVDLADPQNCTDPGYTPGANDWAQFGMAFVPRSADDPCDDVYGLHWDGKDNAWTEGPGVGKLGKFDPVALQMNTIGVTDYNGGDMTGTGDGRLFGFGGVPEAKLIQFDKADAAVLGTIPLAGFPLTDAFAFAFWGGDFYLFTLVDDYTSKVTKLDYDGSDGAGQVLTLVHDDAPIRIVGAGVSTCAPIEPPS